MILATMPPVAEYRQEFTRQATITEKSAWAEASDRYKQGGWWKEVVFSRIERYERDASSPQQMSTFSISAQVANKVRAQLSKVSLQSLPLPAIVPLSGNGLSLTWASGTRAVEVTAFADGEITVDTLDADTYVDPHGGDLETVLKWLIVSPEIQAHHATAR
jgi:hypothetical protein